MRRTIGRYAFPVAVVTLLFGIIATGTFLAIVAGPDIAKIALVPPAASASPAVEATPGSAMALSPIGIAMPEGSDCKGCHVTTDGSVGTKPIPVMGHPLFGWRNCTACHAAGSLVKSAPGHSGLHKDDCLVCHQTRSGAGQDSPPPTRPEHMGTEKPCTACHGVDKHAPLPENMAGRNNCWICHNGPEFTYLFEAGSPDDPGTSPPASPDVAPGASGALSGALSGGSPDARPAAPSEDPAAVSFRLVGDPIP